MKDKTIIIEDKQKTFGDGYAPLQNNLHRDNTFLTIEDTHPSFLIIEDFNALQQNDANKEEISKEKIYYAEEIFDDEDDIYSNAMKDRLLQKEHHRTLFEIGGQINQALSSYGYDTNIGLSLIGSMQFSRLIYLPYREDQRKFMKAVCGALSVPAFFTESSAGGQDDFLAYSNVIYRAVEYAKNNKNKPVFVYTDNLLSRDVFEYYRHFYQYIDNPDGDIYFTALGRSIYIPHNLYFIFSMQDKQVAYDIPRRLFRYVSFLDFNTKVCEPLEKKETITLSLEEIRASLREASDSYGIKEELWKKFDGVIEVINQANGFVLQNKIARRLEDYAICYFTSPNETIEVMDIVLANNFIHEAIITSRPQLYLGEVDVYKAIDNNFGPDSLPLTRKVIREYLDLFDKGGKRLDV
jgi:hypothetical protein